MRRTLLIAFFVLLPAALGRAGVGVAQPEPLDRALARVPSSAEMVVVIDALARARTTPAATELFRLLVDASSLLDADKPDQTLRDGWGAVAAQLGWDELETLDRLLGSRVVLAVSQLSEGANSPWAILSEISAATADQLRERIPSAPRKAVAGLPIFALERGKYEMATRAEEGGGDRVFLLLGPTGRAQLFDVMAEALARGIPDNFATSPAAIELAAVPHNAHPKGAAGVMVAIRFDPPEGAAAPRPWADFLVCTANPRDNAWECRLTLRDAATAPNTRDIPSTSDAPFLAMAPGAMLAILETRLAKPGAEPAGLFERLLALFTLPHNADGILTGRQALAIWPRPAPDAKTPDAVPQLCAAFALETTDVARMAPLGDKHLGSLVEQVERALGGAPLPIPDLAGVSCQAVRSLPLQLPPGMPLSRALGGSAHLAWSYPALPAPPENPPARPGWWQVCVTGASPAGSDAKACDQPDGACAAASRRMVDALLLPRADARTDTWVSVGVVRPAAWSPIARLFLRQDDQKATKLPAAVSLFQRVRSIEWRLKSRDNGDVIGTMSIQMSK